MRLVKLEIVDGKLPDSALSDRLRTWRFESTCAISSGSSPEIQLLDKSKKLNWDLEVEFSIENVRDPLNELLARLRCWRCSTASSSKGMDPRSWELGSDKLTTLEEPDEVSPQVTPFHVHGVWSQKYQFERTCKESFRIDDLNLSSRVPSELSPEDDEASRRIRKTAV